MNTSNNDHPSNDERDANWTAYALGELGDAEARRIERRLRNDSAAAAEIDRLRALASRLKASSDASLPKADPELRAAIVHRLNQPQQPSDTEPVSPPGDPRRSGEPSRPSGIRHNRRLWITGTAIAASLAVVALSQSAWLSDWLERAGDPPRLAETSTLDRGNDDERKDHVNDANDAAEPIDRFGRERRTPQDHVAENYRSESFDGLNESNINGGVANEGLSDATIGDEEHSRRQMGGQLFSFGGRAGLDADPAVNGPPQPGSSLDQQWDADVTQLDRDLDDEETRQSRTRGGEGSLSREDSVANQYGLGDRSEDDALSRTSNPRQLGQQQDSMQDGGAGRPLNLPPTAGSSGISGGFGSQQDAAGIQANTGQGSPQGGRGSPGLAESDERPTLDRVADGGGPGGHVDMPAGGERGAGAGGAADSAAGDEGAGSLGGGGGLADGLAGGGAPPSDEDFEQRNNSDEGAREYGTRLGTLSETEVESNPVSDGRVVEELAEIVGGQRFWAWHRDDERASSQYLAHRFADPYLENQFVAPFEQDALSTFSISVDTASYGLVRRFLRQEQVPPPGAIRVEEMVNYFRYHDAPPEDGQPFAVHLQVATCPWHPEHRLLRIALKAQELQRDDRPLNNLVFLVDVSGSMEEETKLPLLKQALKLFADQLDGDDQIAIVTFADDAQVWLPSTRGDETEVISRAIESLSASGSTHGSAGIQLAYEIAAQRFVEGGVNRVLLTTDGDLNVGISGEDALADLISEQAEGGVFLNVLGLGTGNLMDARLESIANHGNGVYAYVDSLEEARRLLVEQMTGTLVTVAQDVKIQVEFNPVHVARYRLIGYANRLLPADALGDVTIDGGEVGSGHTVVALYEIDPQETANEGAESTDGALRYQELEEQAVDSLRLTEAAASNEWLTVRLSYRIPGDSEPRVLEMATTDEETSLNRARSDFQFSAAVAAFGMILGESRHRGVATLEMVEEIALGALGEDPDGSRAEFLELVRIAARLLQH